MNIEPNAELLADRSIPRVALAGREWPIPELVWRDLKKCRQQLLELSALIRTNIAAREPVASDAGDDVRAASDLLAMSEVLQGLSNEDFDRLVMGPIHAGLVAGHPSLTREELDGWVIDEPDRQWAWLVVRGQAGLFVKQDDAAVQEKEEAPGEA